MGLRDWLRRNPLVEDEPVIEQIGADLGIAVERGEGRARVALVGELDLSNSADFALRLAEAETDSPAVLEVDLRGLTFIDSTGLGQLFAANRRAHAEGRRIQVIKGRGPIERVLNLARVEDVMDVIDGPTT